MATLRLYIQPGAKRSCFKGMHGDRLKLAIAAPPVDGKANQVLVAFLAEVLSIPKRDITLHSGETSRFKTVEVVGLDQAEIDIRLNLIKKGSSRSK